MSLALIFPGQGSQHLGMGKLLAERFPAAAETLAEADEILGLPLSRLMAEGPEDELTETKNAQPAILVHSVAALRSARGRLGDPAYAAGHSLGEFSAHVAAGTLTFADALRTVRLRGELMFHAGVERPGTMAAVLGLGDAEIEAVCARVDAGTCQPANFNSEGQVVISGDVAGVEQGMALAKEAGAKRVMPLKVSGAFHSALMEPAAARLRERLEAVDFRDPSYPVVSNVTAEPVTSGTEARALLVQQVTSPVRWSASIAAMLASGVDRFIEIGPGKVLSTLNRRNADGVPSTWLGEPDDFASLEEA
ncbi:MAG TPA: ACP S-malonyltransferase [Candidatus Limnocylindrales bacterium]|nr:ACP S-malonyltransferase [Candidatus Limnocylindrales bacterium]